jgi:adenosine deaminase
MLPSAELHVHIEGTLEAELVVELAGRNGIALAAPDAAALRERYRFANLQGFLDVYYENIGVARTAEDFRDLGLAYFRRAAAAGVRHAEVFVDPQTHAGNGIPLAAVFEGLAAARSEALAESGLTSGLLVCFLRDRGADAAAQALDDCLPFRDEFLGVGLDSAEVGYPPSLFRDVFARAAAEGLHRVAHAGEEAGPDYVWEALDVLGVERVDHGNRALEDPDLVARLRDDRIPLTVCPLSNLALHTGPASLAAHPLPVMLDEGLLVSVHSDDPAYFGGYVDDNVRALRDALHLSPETLRLLAANSIASSFAAPERKAELFAALARESEAEDALR